MALSPTEASSLQLNTEMTDLEEAMDAVRQDEVSVEQYENMLELLRQYNVLLCYKIFEIIEHALRGTRKVAAVRVMLADILSTQVKVRQKIHAYESVLHSAVLEGEMLVDPVC